VGGTNGRFSPDGRWLAYQSSESGRTEVFVQPYPPTGAKWRVSQNGGVRPRWRRDGNELFYVTLEDSLMAVPIVAAETIQAGEPSMLFSIDFSSPSVNAYPYAVSADGQRFLVITPQETSSAAVSVVVNWTEELKRLVPVN
jgi:Tol biopolymer transport system component